MAHHFTDKEVNAWLKHQPKKVVSAKVVIYNSQHELLLVKPSYKPGWFFVGGIVEANESPLQAALREVKEEVCLVLSPEQLRFVGIRYGVSKRSGDDYLHVIFCATLTDELAKQVQLKDPELEDLQWAPWTDQEKLADHIYIAWQHAKNARRAVYAEQDDVFISAL